MFSEEEEAFRDMVAKFAEKEIAPRAGAMDAAGRLDPTMVLIWAAVARANRGRILTREC